MITVSPGSTALPPRRWSETAPSPAHRAHLGSHVEEAGPGSGSRGRVLGAARTVARHQEGQKAGRHQGEPAVCHLHEPERSKSVLGRKIPSWCFILQSVLNLGTMRCRVEASKDQNGKMGDAAVVPELLNDLQGLAGPHGRRASGDGGRENALQGIRERWTTNLTNQIILHQPSSR